MTVPVAPAPLHIDSSQPFTYLVTTKEGRSVILQGGLLYMLFFLVVPMFMVMGYPVSAARAMLRREPMPSPWRWEHATEGLKVFAVTLVYMLPYFAVVFGAMFWSFTAAYAGPRSAPLFPVVMFPAMAVGMIYAIGVAALNPAIVAALVVTGRISDCFRPSVLRGMIASFRWNYLAAAALAYVVNAAAGIGMIACFIGIFFTAFYAMTVLAHFVAQIAWPHVQPQAMVHTSAPAPID